VIEKVLSLISNAKMAAIAAVAFLVVGIAIGGAATWKVQSWRMADLRSDIALLEQQGNACRGANVANQETIEHTKKEIARIGNSWSARMKAKDALLARLRAIDAIPSRSSQEACAGSQAQTVASRSTNEGKEVRREEDNVSGDPLLDLLNGLFPASADHTN